MWLLLDMLDMVIVEGVLEVETKQLLTKTRM